jgi:hypothetical protein
MYLRGFFDAVEADGVGRGAGVTFWNPNLLGDLQGMDFKQIRDMLLKFYADYPQFRDEQPSMVIMQTLPRIVKGLPPIAATYSAATAIPVLAAPAPIALPVSVKAPRPAKASGSRLQSTPVGRGGG